MLDIGPLLEHERAEWETLARGYKTLYLTSLTDEDYDTAWHSLRRGSVLLESALEQYIGGHAPERFTPLRRSKLG